MPMSIPEIVELIKNSDKILIGIGEEFSCNESSIAKSKTFKIFKDKRSIMGEPDKADWMLETIRKHDIDLGYSESFSNINTAYKALLELIKDKDYYIVSMNTDSILEKSGFDPKRIVYPCGNQVNYQCSNNCGDNVLESKDLDNQIVELIKKQGADLGEIKRPICEKCGSVLVYNTVKSQNYCEAGYLERWKEYMEWTSRTLNKELCILELGVGFQYPTVIRWPFEKICFINNKSHFIRANEKFDQISSELANKSISIKENAVDFLIKLN